MTTAKMNPPAGRDTDPNLHLRRRILRYLRSHWTMTIASCSNSVPWAAAVFYADDGLDLYFLSNPDSRHGTYIRSNSRVSVAIYGCYRDWSRIRGIQLEGRATRLRAGRQTEEFWTIYKRKFPFVEKFLTAAQLSAELRGKLAGVRPYRITPGSLWLIDNALGFGHRERLDGAPAERSGEYRIRTGPVRPLNPSVSRKQFQTSK